MIANLSEKVKTTITNIKNKISNNRIVSPDLISRDKVRRNIIVEHDAIDRRLDFVKRYGFFATFFPLSYPYFLNTFKRSE